MKHHTNKHLRRALALFMTVLMAMSCVSAGLSALAAIDGIPTRDNKDSFFTDATLYGAEKWDQTSDVASLTFNWNAYSGSIGYDPQPGTLTFTYPSHIYLNVGETLEAAGYMGHMTASYGENEGDATDFRVMLSSATWGESTRSGFSPISSLISGYSHQGTVTEGTKLMTGSSSHYDFSNDGRGSDQIIGNKSGDNENFLADNESVVVWRSNIKLTSPGLTNFDEYVLLKGTAAKTGEVTFNPTTEQNFTIGAAQRYTAFAWHSDNGTRFNRYAMNGGSRPQTTPAENALSMTFTVYDKSELARLVAAIDNGSLTADATAIANARAILADREVTQAQIDAAAASIGDRMTLLVNEYESDYTGVSSSDLNVNGFTNINDPNGKVYHYWTETASTANGITEYAYGNVVWAPAAGDNNVNWSGSREMRGGYFRIAAPTATVLVYDGIHTAKSPILFQNKTGNNSISWEGSTNQTLYFDTYWHGYCDGGQSNDGVSNNDKNWPTSSTSGSNTGYISGTINVDNCWNSSHTSTYRSFWNTLVYHSTGNNIQTYVQGDYYETFNNGNVEISGKYRDRTDFPLALPGTVYVLRYDQIQSQLEAAIAKKAIVDDNSQNWMYTETSLKKVKATIAAIDAANPANFNYNSNVAQGVADCAAAIADAKYMLDNDGLTLVKKQGTVTFVSQTGETLAINGQPATYTKEYGETIVANEIPQLSNVYYRTDNAQWDYGTELSWSPALPATITVDEPEKIFQISDEQTVQTYTVTFYDEDGTKVLKTVDCQYGDYPVWGSETAPTKAASAQKTYKFDHWVDTAGNTYALNGALKGFTVADVASSTRADLDTDAMKKYTAVFVEDQDVTYPVTITAGANTTLTVKNGDAVLASGDEVPYGTVLTIEAAVDAHYTQHGVLTVKVNDAAYTETTYTVTSATTIATDDVTTEKNRYTVTWVDQWGAVISSTTVEAGWSPVMPIDDPADVRIEDKVWRFDHWDNGKTAGQSIAVTEDTTITAIYTLTDEVAKYTVKFLNDDNYTVIATAEYEYNAAVAVPETPVSTNRTKELDYTFTGWTPEVAANVTADATYVATYETEAHSRLYPVKWVYGNDETVAKEEILPYDTVFTADDIPAPVIVKDDQVTHKEYEWAERIGTALANHIGNDTTEAIITAVGSVKRHECEPSYQWVGNYADGYTACIATMTCTACGEELRAEASFTQPTTTHTGENCQDRSYTSYLASLSGSGANSYFENQTKKVNGDYGPHFYPTTSVEFVWNTADLNNVTCTAKQTCSLCGNVKEEPGAVSEYDTTDATCANPATVVFKAVFENWDDQYSNEIVTAPADPTAHEYNRVNPATTIRPVYDEATDTWSKGELHIGCENTFDWDTQTYDASHDKVIENVDRADYSAFDEVYDKFVAIKDLDINPDETITVESPYGGSQDVPFSEILAYVNRALASDDAFPQDYTTTHGGEFDEQPYVDMMAQQLGMIVGSIYNDDGSVKDGLLNTYTITFVTDGSPVTDITGALKGDEIALPETTKDGFHFEGWYTDESHADGTKAADPYTVTGDATLYAFFEELSLNGDDVEAAITAATAGVSGICYTEASYTAYTNAVAAVRAFKDQPATSENLAAYNNALSALDAAVAGLVVEHTYTGEPTITRPVFDEATGTWSKGVKTWTCANNADHPVKTEEVDRADYATYDSVLEQISNLLNEDLTDDVKTALETAKTSLEAIPQNYITDEQTTLDNAIQAILDTLKANDKIDVDENNTITVDPDTAYKTYTLKIYNNVNTDYMEFTHKAGTTARLDPTLAGYTLKGFSENANYNAETGLYTFPQADDTITALFVKDLTDNETIENAQQIIADETNPDSGKDYDDDYIDDLNDLLDEINAIKDDPTKLDKLDEKLEALQTLVDKAEQNRVYTITWSIDGVETTEPYKVDDTPTHEDPTKEGFRFTGWEPSIAAVTGDTTYTAVFTEASAEPAYYAEYDAVFAKLETVPTNDKVTAELKAEAQDKLEHPLRRDLTADQQQIIDDEVAAIRAILDKIFEKDSNGNYTDDVKDGAAVKYTVVFHWLGATLTRTVVSGKGAKGPDLTRLYGVEGMEGGHFVFNRWVKDSEDSGIPADITNVTENMDVYAEYKQEAHTGAWIEHEATCTESSWAEIDCTLCGMHFTKKTDTSPELGHAWGDWVVVTAATCAHPGRQTRTCTRDASHTETAVIPQLAHTDANGDTICDVCGNPTENHQHTDVNGDGKCDTCGATTDAHVHNYQNGVCTGCGQTQDGSFRCNLCSVYEQYRHIPVAGWFLTAFHFFYHLICQITSWR